MSVSIWLQEQTHDRPLKFWAQNRTFKAAVAFEVFSIWSHSLSHWSFKNRALATINHIKSNTKEMQRRDSRDKDMKWKQQNVMYE